MCNATCTNDYNLAAERRRSVRPTLLPLGPVSKGRVVSSGCFQSARKLYNKRRELVRRGLVALVDGRATQPAVGPAVDDLLRAAIVAEAQELADRSDVRKMQFRARVASRLARDSGEPLELPASRQDVQSRSWRSG